MMGGGVGGVARISGGGRRGVSGNVPITVEGVPESLGEPVKGVSPPEGGTLPPGGGTLL